MEQLGKYKSYNMIDPSNKIHHTAIIYDNVVIGKNNTIGAYSIIGSNGEVRGVKEFKGDVIIGDNNVISEYVTIQRPKKKASTIIGNNNLIMAHSHIGHDVNVGNDCEICTGTIIGGYAKIEDKVKLKLGVTIRNRITVEHNSVVGMGSVIIKKVLKGSVVVGNPGKTL